jgi:LDH2 family malate/lactate/ureidoglycolate dehydrogenase
LRAAEGDGPPRAGHFFMAIDPKRFRDDAAFRGDLDALIDDLRATKPIDAAQPVLVAGDPEYVAAEARLRGGIPLSRFVVEDMRLICSESGVAFNLTTQ